MPTEPPIACSLSAGDMRERLTQMAALGRDALLRADVAGSRATLRFAADPGVHRRVTAIAAAEAQCCAFLTMAVHDGRDAVELVVEGPDGAAPLLRELVDAFRGESQVSRASGRAPDVTGTAALRPPAGTRAAPARGRT